MTKTHIAFVLDSSGSMSSIREDTIGGFNSFLLDQQDEEGTATVTLCEFSSSVQIVYEGRSIESAPTLSTNTYTPGGQTALYDAIFTTVYETKHRIQQLTPNHKPDNVIVVVLTDGKENASETHQSKVRNQVATMREEYDWEFLFIGANQDAALTADSMGMNEKKSLNMAHSGDGAQSAYESTSKQISQARRKGSTEGYNDEDRSRQTDASDS